MASLQDLNLALGEFLTETSRVEHVMLSLTMVCQSDRSTDDVFREFLGQTFGRQIVLFKKTCDSWPHFMLEHKKALAEVYTQLDTLLRKRNHIVHGASHKLRRRNDGPIEAYRIGLKRGEWQYLSNFSIEDLDAEHSFTVERIRQTTKDFESVRRKLSEVALFAVFLRTITE